MNVWANIGYFFFKKEALKYFFKHSSKDLEMGIVKKIAMERKLFVYKHKGFWKSVDTQKNVKEF